MRLSEIDLDRQEALNETRQAYGDTFDAYMALIAKYPPAHRKPWQQDEISKAEGRCTIAKMKYEIAQSERYKVKV